MHSSVCAPVTNSRPDPAGGERLLEVGLLEGVGVGLVHERLGVVAEELGHVLPGLAVARHVVTGVLDPDDVDVRGPGAINQRADVRDDRVTLMRAADDAVLDVDHEQRALWSGGKRRHETSRSLPVSTS